MDLGKCLRDFLILENRNTICNSAFRSVYSRWHGGTSRKLLPKKAVNDWKKTESASDQSNELFNRSKDCKNLCGRYEALQRLTHWSTLSGNQSIRINYQSQNHLLHKESNLNGCAHQFEAKPPPTLKIVTKNGRESQGNYLLNNEGNFYFGSLQDLTNDSELRKAGLLPKGDTSSTSSSEDLGNAEVKFSLGSKSKIVLEFKRSVNDSTAKSDEGTNDNSRGINTELMALSTILCMPFLSDEGVSCKCNFPPMYSMMPSTSAGLALLGTTILAGVGSPLKAVDRDSKMFRRSLKAFWQHLCSSSYRSPKDVCLASAPSLYTPTDDERFVRGFRTGGYKKEIPSVWSTIDEASQITESDNAIELTSCCALGDYGSSNVTNSEGLSTTLMSDNAPTSGCELPPRPAIDCAANTCKGGAKSSAGLCGGGSKKESRTGSGKPTCGEVLKKSESKGKSRPSYCGGGKGGSGSDPCPKVKPKACGGGAAKEFFTSPCFWLCQYGAIDAFLLFLFAFLIFNDFAEKPKEDNKEAEGHNTG